MNLEIDVATRAAVVLPFPMRAPAPDDRLARALASLRKALAEQDGALAEWRESLGDLGAALSGLQGSLVRYRCTLDGLAAGVEALHTEAECLETLPL